MRQVSLISRTPLFTLIDGDLRTGDLLTREEAVLAAVRLYESIPEKIELMDEADALPQVNAHESAIAPDDNPEIQRAIKNGFVPEDMREDWEKVVTYSEFCTMLLDVMTLTNPDLQAPWPG